MWTSAMKAYMLCKGWNGNNRVSEWKHWIYVPKVTELYASFGKQQAMIATTGSLRSIAEERK